MTILVVLLKVVATLLCLVMAAGLSEDMKAKETPPGTAGCAATICILIVVWGIWQS